jgi:pimeloyl-ACP methyl ester carboxylesterase
VAYEPPYGALAEGEWHTWFVRVAEATAAAHRAGGAPAAAETFLRAVAGDAAWERLPERARSSLGREGDGALADVAQTGLDPDGLRRIAAPVAILTGTASEPFYAPLADILAARIAGARRLDLPGAVHTTPITDPAPVAAAIRSFLELPA